MNATFCAIWIHEDTKETKQKQPKVGGDKQTKKKIKHFYHDSHNIIQIHNNVMWDWM